MASLSNLTMPRRGSTKRLNISTDQKFEPHGESSNQNEASRHQPQHQPLNRQSNILVQQALPNTSMHSVSSSQIPSSITGESNDSRGAPPNLPQHRQSPALITNPIADKPRSVQIEALLKHRKLLLQRIRQSKKAAETRLANPSTRSMATILAEYTVDIKLDGHTKGKDAEDKKLSEENAYKELGRLASQAAKKQRNQDEGADKRASLSLRRGSTVGKRMSAAISALSPGVAETLSDTATLLPAPSKVPTPTPPPPPSNTKNVGKKMKKSGSSGILNSTQLPGVKNVNDFSANVTKKRSSIKSQKVTSQPRNPYTYGATSHPIDNSPKQSVIFPAAIALRERKKRVEEKLNKLILQRQNGFKREEKNTESGSRVRINNGLELSKFPQRRKTRWDYLMEEMRWLATDFCEERKWKRTSSCALSLEIISHFDTLKERQNQHENDASKEPDISQAQCSLNSIVAIDDEKKDADMILHEEKKIDRKENDRQIDLLSRNDLYIKPSEVDNAMSRSIAKNMSKQITVLWNKTLNGFISSDLSQNSMGKDRDKESLKDKSETTNVPEKKFTPNIPGSDQSKTNKGDTNCFSPSSNATPKVSNKAIKRNVDSLLKKIKNRPRQRSIRAKQSSKGVKPNLTPVEQNASDFIEFLWKGDDPVGGIFGNALSFSPFDVVCSLIPHNTGPHVILCPSSRVLYWHTELNRICNRVIILTAGSSQEELRGLTSTDVVVAESFNEAMENQLDLSIYETVILDASFTFSTKRSIPVQELRSLMGDKILSGEWWNSLLIPMLRRTQKRLLISNSFAFGSREESSLFKLLPEKERLECLSGMAAFAFGPKNFISKKNSVVHKVLSWAKYAVTSDKIKAGKTVDLIENYLILNLRKVLFSPEAHYGVMQQQFEEKSTVDTEVCLCKMSSTQQKAYDKCCRSIRGALSLGNSISDAAKALMQLRDVCFHSRLRDICRTFSSNSSQPDIHKAVEIMTESAKLKKLISLLYRDFGYKIKGLQVLRDCFRDFQPKSKRVGKQIKKTLPKIAIIASSPSARKLTSIILSAVGIDHECLPGREIDINRETTCDLLSWLEGQSSLQRYNNTNVDQSGMPSTSKNGSFIERNCNIIVGSAASLGAQQVNGLSLEASDTLILLDEDWSGREHFLMKNLLFRCYLHRKRQDKERSELRIYRLICDDTCEKKLLCTSNDGDDNLDIETEDWAVGGLGLLELKESFPSWDQSFSHYEPYYLFKFPCLNLLSFANQDLALFLGTKDPLPKTLEAKKRLEFLPFSKKTNNVDEQRKQFLSFGKELCVEEEINYYGSGLARHLPLNESILPKSVSLTNIQTVAIHHFMEANGTPYTYIAEETPDKIQIMTSYKSIHAPPEKAKIRESSMKADNNRDQLIRDQDVTSDLFYGTSVSELSQKKRKRDSNENIGGQQQTKIVKNTRFNAFSAVYTTATTHDSAVAQDGSLGFESLVYFPPLLPSLRSIAPKAVEHVSSHVAPTKEMQHKTTQLINTKSALEPEGNKRSFEVANRLSEASKRPRVQTCEENGASLPNVPGITSAESSKPEVETTELNEESHRNDSKDLATTGSLPGSVSQVTSSSVMKCEEEKLFDDAKNTIVGLNEDYGILGVGAIPQKSHSQAQAANEAVELSHYNTTKSSQELYLPYDFEEHDYFNNKSNTNSILGMMILFAAKKGMHPMRSAYTPTQGLSSQSHPAPWNAPSNALPMGQFMGAGALNGSTTQNNNGSSQIKKGKKKSTTPPAFIGTAPVVPGRMPNDFNSQVAAGFAPALSHSKGKDALRHKLLAMHGRHSYGTASLFESATFRSAFNRLRDRIKEKASKDLSFPGGYVTMQSSQSKTPTQNWNPLVQHSTKHRWTTLVTNRNFESDEKTLYHSGSDESDFGPFQVGRLVSVTDIVNLPHPKPMLGLSLPMGVKIPSRHMDQGGQPWTVDEDKELQALSMRFGMNWHLVACNLKCTSKSHLRSARQCRERWHNLAAVDPALLNEMQKEFTESSNIRKSTRQGDKTAEGIQDFTRMAKKTIPMPTTHETTSFLSSQLMSNNKTYDCLSVGNSTGCDESPPQYPGPLSFSGSLPKDPSEPIQQTPQPPPPIPKTRRKFEILRGAAMKKQDVPMQIPGVVTGQKPSLAASHHSHHQSLQVAVAALSSGGRTDMWPLQILDLADKQRKAIARSQPNMSSGRTSQRPTGGYQTSQSRHTTGQQQYGQPNNQTRHSAQNQPPTGK